MAAMRSRMKQAMQKEEDPNRLTELVLESMEFGDALQTERTALQVLSVLPCVACKFVMMSCGLQIGRVVMAVRALM